LAGAEKAANANCWWEEEYFRGGRSKLERYLRILPQPTGLLLPFDDNNVVCASLWPASSAATWASPDLTSSHCHCHQRHGHNHSLGQLGSVEEKELEEGEDNPLSWALSARWADFPELTPCLLLQIRTCRAKKSGLFWLGKE